MNEFNEYNEHNEEKIQDVPFTSKEVHKEPNEKHKTSSLFKIIVAALVCLGSGYGGGYLAVKQYGQPTVVYKEAPMVSNDQTTNETSQRPVVLNNSNDSLSLQEIAQKAAPSVVEITSDITQQGVGFFGTTVRGQSAGSGVILSDDGYIITNNHVVANADRIQIKTYDGTVYEAELVGTDPKSDIGVIKVDAKGLTPATVGESSTLEVGDTAVVIGNPLGTLGGTVTNGIISAIDREVTINNEAMTLLQTNAAINSGNSGGGMFDGNGNLIGIVNAKDSGMTSSGATIEGLGFAIPIDIAMDVATQIMDNGYVADRATIGVSLQTLPQDYGNYKAGLYVNSVLKGSGAEKAGLQPYDRLVACDGNEISSYPELSKILKTKKVGDHITLTVIRDGKQIMLDVELTAPVHQDK